MVLRKDRSRILHEPERMHCLLRYNAHLLPADPSTVPAMFETEKSCTRVSMSRILIDTVVRGMASGNSTASDSKTSSGLTDEEQVWCEFWVGPFVLFFLHFFSECVVARLLALEYESESDPLSRQLSPVHNHERGFRRVLCHIGHQSAINSAHIPGLTAYVLARRPHTVLRSLRPAVT